ncbi:MAG: GNAT family N-acetyltransferase [Bacteriovorax sp.]|nr:GNAT family N-acetyltransferase [Bacteriovorax sp.]
MNETYFEIRPILPTDKIQIQVGLKMLSPESIRQRFFTNKKEFSEKELQFLTEVDQVNHLAYVAVHHKNGNQLPAGVIRAIKRSDLETHAEIGIVIVDCYQGMGLGRKLFEEVAARAVAVGITHFYGDYHTSNLKMTHLLNKFAKTRSPLILKHTGDGFIYFEALLKN